MNTQTGRIVQLTPEEARKNAASENPLYTPLGRMPDPKCHRCHGRGHLGFDRTHQCYSHCRCTRKKASLVPR